MPNPHLVTVNPGQQVVIDVSFSAIWENRLRILDEAGVEVTGGYFNNRGINGPNGGQWRSGVNTTLQNWIFAIHAEYKKGRNDPNLPTGNDPWQNSAGGKELSPTTSKNAVIGFNDGGKSDEDYNDAVAKIAWL